MLKTGLKFLFGTLSQIIFVIIAYQFYFRYAQTTGGVGGTVISNIHPIIWAIVMVELVISGILIALGFKKDNI